jgi:hypothetical protein
MQFGCQDAPDLGSSLAPLPHVLRLVLNGGIYHDPSILLPHQGRFLSITLPFNNWPHPKVSLRGDRSTGSRGRSGLNARSICWQFFAAAWYRPCTHSPYPCIRIHFFRTATGATDPIGVPVPAAVDVRTTRCNAKGAHGAPRATSTVLGVPTERRSIAAARVGSHGSLFLLTGVLDDHRTASEIRVDVFISVAVVRPS